MQLDACYDRGSAFRPKCFLHKGLLNTQSTQYRWNPIVFQTVFRYLYRPREGVLHLVLLRAIASILIVTAPKTRDPVSRCPKAVFILVNNAFFDAAYPPKTKIGVII